MTSLFAQRIRELVPPFWDFENLLREARPSGTRIKRPVIPILLSEHLAQVGCFEVIRLPHLMVELE